MSFVWKLFEFPNNETEIRSIGLDLVLSVADVITGRLPKESWRRAIQSIQIPPIFSQVWQVWQVLTSLTSSSISDQIHFSEDDGEFDENDVDGQFIEIQPYMYEPDAVVVEGQNLVDDENEIGAGEAEDHHGSPGLGLLLSL